jgi:hypothetical protein
MMKRSSLLAMLILMITIILIIWRESLKPTAIQLVPSLSGEPEYCLSCHNDLPEISPSHPIDTFGCVICHGGEPLALEADLAHSTMRSGQNPSDLQVVEDSCGGADCHSAEAGSQSDHIQRVMTSIQATYAGAISNVRFSFGAQPDQSAAKGIYSINDLDGDSRTSLLSLDEFRPKQETNPILLTFAENCLFCHISAEPLAGTEYSRLTGCASCHTLTANFDLMTEDRASIHQLTTAIPYSQCNTCHNRGNYDLSDMRFHSRTDNPSDRLNDYYQPIAQFVRCEWTLDCIDCHTRIEAMGDGDIYSNQADIQYIQCRTCHGTIEEAPLTQTIRDQDDLALKLAFINPVIDLQIGDAIIITEQGEPLWNIRQLSDGLFEQFGKATGQRFLFRPVIETDCQQNPQQQESQHCHTCHAIQK